MTDNLTTITSIKPFELSEILTTEQIEPIEPSNEYKQNYFIERPKENNLTDLWSNEDYIENMSFQHDNKSTNSTHTSISSIHDIHLDPNELAYRLARLDSNNVSSPPKKTLADELAELGEAQSHFENDSLDHTPPMQQIEQVEEKQPNEDLISTPHIHSITIQSQSPLNIDQLTLIVQDIRNINQEKPISSLRTIIEDIHSKQNTQFLTEIVDYHQSPAISNLQAIIDEMHQTSIGKSIPRSERPIHLLDTEEDKSSVPPVSIPISSMITDREQQLTTHKTISYSSTTPHSPPSLTMQRQISELSIPSTRYQTQRIDKVSDLEIVKQGKGFKIGYTDRQGTDQRVILTKRIEAGPDIMGRNPSVRLPYKGRKILKQVYSAVLHTNGYSTIQEDEKFQHLSDDIEVPIIGTNPEHFDEVGILLLFLLCFLFDKYLLIR